MPLERSWFERDAPVVAAELLNKLLVVDRDGLVCSGRITETEAYMPDDPASHTFRGPTPRNQVMFGPAGHLYVYLSYGIHHCVNVVTGSEGSGQAVLLRAIEPIDGIAVMRTRRNRSDRELANGPGKIGQAFGIDRSHSGLDLTHPDETIRVSDDGTPPPKHPLVGPRVGISKGIDTPWRFSLPGP